jgi:hypothetical protein
MFLVVALLVALDRLDRRHAEAREAERKIIRTDACLCGMRDAVREQSTGHKWRELDVSKLVEVIDDIRDGLKC